jgi:hypothetical protein
MPPAAFSARASHGPPNINGAICVLCAKIDIEPSSTVHLKAWQKSGLLAAIQCLIMAIRAPYHRQENLIKLPFGLSDRLPALRRAAHPPLLSNGFPRHI